MLVLTPIPAGSALLGGELELRSWLVLPLAHPRLPLGAGAGSSAARAAKESSGGRDAFGHLVFSTSSAWSVSPSCWLG